MQGSFATIGQEELPPRARRIRTLPGSIGAVGGTTSACAENTKMLLQGLQIFRNYLRVRGEYLICISMLPKPGELPPRARRILYTHGLCHLVFGTTSACAENTRNAALFDHPQWNYLRVRGEYSLMPPS